MPAAWVFATNNRHKLEEVQQAVGRLITVISLAEAGCTDNLPETGHTLEDNARQKAEYVFKKLGVACFADDSGLEVEALDGEPGAASAHYAGPHRSSSDNINLLLEKLKGISSRKARFRCVIALADSCGTQLFEGILSGSITSAPRGNNGFGYDPVFVPDGETRTLAEMTMEEKNRISHRARAVSRLARYLLTKEKLSAYGI